MSVIQNPNGWDVIFSPNPDASSPYDHEIEPGVPYCPLVGAVRTTGDVIAESVSPHPYVTGSIILCQTGGLAPDGQYTVTNLDATHFSLDGTPGSPGANGGGVACGIYDAPVGSVGFWVRIPTLSHTADNVFYMFYNKAGVVTSPEHVNAVWPAPATAIFHYPRGDPFGSAVMASASPDYGGEVDSTGNGYTGIIGGGLAQAGGQIQKGLTGGGLFQVITHSCPVLTGPVTATIWMNLNVAASGRGNAIRFLDTSNGKTIRLGFNFSSPGHVYPYINYADVGSYEFTGIDYPPGEWVKVTWQFHGTALYCEVYRIGHALQTQSLTADSAFAYTPDEIDVGEDISTGSSWDEVNIFLASLTANESITIGNNQSDPTFITIGAELPGAGGYNFSRSITVDHTKVIGADYTNFALLVNTLLPVGDTPPVNPTIACALSSAIVGVPYSSSVMASGGTAPYTYAIIAGALPTGLSLDTSTGAITGTPTTAGSSSYTPEVTDSLGNTGQIDCSITVSAPSLTCSINVGTQGASYSSFVQVIGGTAPYAFSIISGSLPPGLSLDPVTGAITGIPTTTGAYSYEVQVVDSSANTLHTNCGISVEPPVIGAYFELIRCIPTFKPARHLPVRGSAK